MGDVAPGREQLFGLYVSGRHLQELADALRLLGVESWYARPGVGGVLVPRLYVKHPWRGWPDHAVCATCHADTGETEWWLSRLSPHLGEKRICRAGDMGEAARLVVEEFDTEQQGGSVGGW